jgi:signal transduction histidine kinase
LVKRRFGFFVSAADLPCLTAFLTKVFESKVMEFCEVTLLKAGDLQLEVRIEAVVAASGLECRAMLEDITELKRAKEDMRSAWQQLRALAARVQTAREEERTHAAREIHDVLAQELTALKIDLAWLNRRLAEPLGTLKQELLQARVHEMMDLTDQASQSVQRISAELRPVVLDSLGLCAAVKWVAADFQKRT